MILTPEELQELGEHIFEAVGVPHRAAASVTRGLVAAELDGLPSHGFSRIPAYADQVKSGKVKKNAVPRVDMAKPGAILVDADFGFAFPALDEALACAADSARINGISLFAVTRSHHCGALGYHVERMARQNLVALMFSNSPAAMAPWNGNRAIFGTNPIAFACPRPDADPIVVDMSLSKVARGKIMLARQRGERIPAGWAIDRDGSPTTDPDKAMEGSMMPVGDAKGAALALMVEILSAALPGAHFGFQASSMFTAEGPSPGIGQSGIVIDPSAVNAHFPSFVDTLCHAVLSQSGTRLPGQRRFELRARNMAGVELPDALYEELVRRAS